MAGKNNPVNSYQEATNQLLAINAQRKNNVSQAKMEEMVAAAQNNTLAQASDFADSNSTTTTMNADLNPATQNILRQYGLGQPKIQKTSSSSREVNKQNIVINNKNTTVTNNNVQVAPQTGPTQGRQLQLQDQGQIRFKTWLSNSFAQQNEIAAKRQREYSKRDSALERSSNKLMKKLEDMGTKVATNLNPKNMASSMGKQLKTLLLVFGFGYMAKNWPRLIDTVDRIGKFFKPGEGLVKMLGGKENETFFQAFKKLFTDPDEGIFPYIGQWLKSRFKERGEAIKSVPKPDISNTSLALNPLKALGEITRYLGDILKAIMDPSSAAQNTVKNIAVDAETKYQKDNHDILRERSGKKDNTSMGDMAIVNGKYQSVKPGSIDKNGNLVNSPAASVSQGNEIVGAIENSKKGNIQTATVATGLSRLYNAAKKNEHGVVLSEDFLTQYLSADELKRLGLERSKKFIYVIRPKTEEEKALDNLDINRDTKTVNTVGTYLQTTGIFTPVGNVLKTIDDIKKDINPDKTIELRDASLGVNWEAGEDVFDNKKDGVPQNLYEVTPEAIQMIADKLTGKQNINIDLGNEEFVKAIENSLLKNVPEGTNLNKINRDIDIDRTYSVSKMIESNNAELQERRNNLRLKTGIENTKNMAKETKNNIHNRIFGDYSSNSNNNSDSDWSGIRINKKDNKTAHPGTGAVGKQNINREYLTNLLTREISGEFGRKEGNPNGCYMNPQDGGDQAGHGNYGYGNTYNTLKEWYKGPVSFKLADGTIKTFRDLKSADEWFVQYCKVNNTLGSSPANKKVVLTDETAAAINKMSIGKFIDSAIKMDPDIMAAMDEQTLGGLLHIAYGGTGRYKKLINFYNTNKEEAIADLQANNGVHSEDFINRVMMNTPEGYTAMQTDNSNGVHFDRRGYLTGYHAFGVYSASEWNKHLNQSSAPQTEFTASSNSPAVQPTSITANSNMTNQYPSAFSSGGDNTTAFSSTNDINRPIDYSKKLNDVNLNLVALQQVLKEEVGVTGQGVDATHNLASAISSALRTSQKQPESRSYTDIYNDKLSKRS